MRTTIAIAMVLAVCACGRTGPRLVPCPDCVPEQGGASGSGGTSDGGAGGKGE